ncbi:MAG: hypothetical protein NXH95_00350 [Pseudomonadaceae bacterium]|nr:hypothetical protein [Pseudomonadaceae bacterium]
MHQTYLEILRILAGAWKQRYAGLAAAWLVAVAGVVFVAMQKDVYEASARVYVNTASQLRMLLGDQIVDSNVEDQLRYVREALLGRPQLEHVAREVGLILEDDPPEVVAAIVGMLSSNIQLVSASEMSRQSRFRGPQTDDTYFISYHNNDRQVALAVVQKLLSIFVEDTLGAKQTSSRAAGEFLSGQIAEYQARLQSAEAALADFNRRNFDKLPNLQGGYFQRLQTARQNMEESNQALNLANSRLDSIERQMRGEAPRLTAGGQMDPNSVESRILVAQSQLDSLRLRFTEEHPDVIAAREILTSLRKQIAELYGDRADLDAPSNNPVFQALQISRNEIKTEIAELSAEYAQRRSQVRELEGLIGEMPEVEAEMARLTRDYDVIRNNYQALLSSLERENLSREVLESDEMEFRIVDPPTAGIEPVAPRRALFTAFVMMLSLGAGFVVAYVLNQLQPVIDRVETLQKSLNLPVIGSVSISDGGGALAALGGARAVVYFCLLGGLLILVMSLLTLSEIIGPGLVSFR